MMRERQWGARDAAQVRWRDFLVFRLELERCWDAGAQIEHARDEEWRPGEWLEFSAALGRQALLDLQVGGVRTKAVIDTGAQQTIGNERLRKALLLRWRKTQDADIIGVTSDVTQAKHPNSFDRIRQRAGPKRRHFVWRAADLRALAPERRAGAVAGNGYHRQARDIRD
jgi:hypothetical protein